MSVTLNLWCVYEDDPQWIDCRVDVLLPMANFGQYLPCGFLVERSTMPTGYTWDDICDDIASQINTPGLEVTHDPEPSAPQQRPAR